MGALQMPGPPAEGSEDAEGPGEPQAEAQTQDRRKRQAEVRDSGISDG